MDYIHEGRTNLLEIPATSDGSLIVALHGGFGNPLDLKTIIQLELEFPDSYVLYADADDAASNLWASNDNDRDVVYLQGLIHKVKLEYPAINKDNIHIIGHSNGAMMGYKLCAYLDEAKYKSLTVISGAYTCPEVFDFKGSVLHIHGGSDTIVPLLGSNLYEPITTTIEKVSANGLNNTFKIITNAEHELSALMSKYPDFYADIRKNLGL